jgi:hypothetical protein
MLVFTYLGLLWGLVCFDLPADASGIYLRSMVSTAALRFAVWHRVCSSYNCVYSLCMVLLLL